APRRTGGIAIGRGGAQPAPPLFTSQGISPSGFATMSIEPPEHQPKAPSGHDHGKSDNLELIFSLTCGALLVVGWLGPKLGIVPGWLSVALLAGAYIFGGFFALKEAIEKVADGKFEIDFLMLVAA